MRRMRTEFLVAALLATLVGSAGAFSSIGTAWRAAYPDACAELTAASNDCTMCHVNGFDLNTYASDYSGDWTAIEGLDSDGDGRTNIQEIEDCTEPWNENSLVGNDASTWSAVKSLYR